MLTCLCGYIYVCVTIWKLKRDIGAFLSYSPPWFLRHGILLSLELTDWLGALANEFGDLFSQPPQNWDDRHMYAPQPVFYMGAEDPSAGLMLTWHDYFALLQIV